MALEVGSVFSRLGARLDDDAFDRFDRRVDKARRSAEHPIEQRLDTKADTSGIDRYERRVKDVDNEHRNLVRGSGRVRTALGTMFIGGAGVAGFGALALGAKAVVGQFQESQRVGRQTAQVIKSTGAEAGVSAKHVGDLATALSRKTGIDDEAIQSGENLLLTFTNIRNEAGKGNAIFDRSSKLLTDMSAALGQDMSSSAIQLGKALNDPVKGITALQRVGVSFTAQQKEQIKGLVEHGKTLDAQKIILRELNKEFGGSAEAQATNTKKLGVAFGNLEESVGGVLAPTIEKAAGGLTKLVDGFTNGTGSAGKFRRGVGQAVDGVKGFLTGLERAGERALEWLRDNKDAQRWARNIKQAGELVIDAVRDIGRSIARTFSGSGENLRAILAAFIKVEAFVSDVFLATLKRALPGIVALFKGVATVIRGVVDVVGGILRGDWRGAWNGAKKIVSGSLQAVLGLVRALSAPLRTAIAAVGRVAGGAFDKVWGGIVSTARGFVNAIIDVINVIPGIPNIKHVGGGGGGGAKPTTGASAPRPPAGGQSARPRSSSDDVGAFYAGGKVTQPMAIVGEEAPRYPEYVIPTNPAYRGRARGLLASAASAIGMGDAGDVAGAVGRKIGGVASSVAGAVGSIIGKLPTNPFGPPVEGLGSYVLDKVKDFIKSKAGSIFGGGGGPFAALRGATSLDGVPVANWIARILKMARGAGVSFGISSGVRSFAEQTRLWNALGRDPAIVARPGTSNHEATDFPRGAVDISPGWAELDAWLRQHPGLPLHHYGNPRDPYHFSATGNRTGGILGRGIPLSRGELGRLLRRGVRGLATGGIFSATSYGPPWGGIQGAGVTRTGVNLKGSPHVYGVAVDPSVIPLGSMLNIWPNPFGTHSRFKAFDTGGAIRGHRLDFYDWRGRPAQNRWGRRNVRVTVAAARGVTVKAPAKRKSHLAIEVPGRPVPDEGPVFSTGITNPDDLPSWTDTSPPPPDPPEDPPAPPGLDALLDYFGLAGEASDIERDVALADITDDTADDEAARRHGFDFYTRVLAQLRTIPGISNAAIIEAAGRVKQFKPDVAAAPAAPTQTVEEALASFDVGRRDLFTQFGANFMSPTRLAALVGGRGSSSDYAAGLRYFGAGSSGSEGGAIAAAGGRVELHQHVTIADPGDQFTLAQAALHELRAAL